ncbi:C-type lectin domain family 17, member A-like [Limanda limanda]|uniref:C-type lectin domain family 17, member A-like n=1 Tax=Limanda limanda TaxID=27771 RepID=UPI0029C8998D|nr:C-type lectin domain family 17, member A-like [Limanda limanda]
MEEELNYATVVFKNGGSPQKVKAAGGTVAAGGAAAGGAAAAHSRHFVLLLVCLGILCVLLIACIGVIIYIFGVMKAQEAVAENVIHLEKENVIHLEKENHRLMMEKEILANEKEILANKTDLLTRDRDDLNRTLRVIMTFQNFQVNTFCPDKKCQPCRESWIPFQDHCYLFYEQPPRWKTWTQARTICQKYVSDLLVVDSLQEQEFINKHTKYYYTSDHAYWMGLLKNEDNMWIWIDGRNETLGFWIQERVKNSGAYAMTFPGHNATASWGPSWHGFQLKFICEHEALIRTPVKTGTKLLHILLLLVTAAFGIICVVLVSVAIVLRNESVRLSLLSTAL